MIRNQPLFVYMLYVNLLICIRHTHILHAYENYGKWKWILDVKAHVYTCDIYIPCNNRETSSFIQSRTPENTAMLITKTNYVTQCTYAVSILTEILFENGI